MMDPRKELEKIIHGSGGGGSSAGKQHTPVTAPDTIASKAYLAMLDLLCEGQVKGLVEPKASSIFIDGTPLANPDGSVNYEGFEWQFRDGRQDQAVIDGFPDVVTPYASGVQIKTTTPQTITVKDIDADQVRVVITIPALSSQNTSNGDVNGTVVEFQFMLSVNDGSFLPINVAGTDSSIVRIADKSRSKYQAEYLFDLPKPAKSYKLRVQRITPDSTSSYLANDTFLDSHYEIINSQLTYPNSVMMGIKLNSEQLASNPERAYLIDGMLLRIPSNYNPDSRTYSGVWDGTFKIGYSNNPAWVCMDIILSKRYGLGEFVTESDVNTAKLYQIARYCDAMVDNGFGGLEPRFTLNTCIASRNDAYKVISDVCSVFRGMSYWQGGMVQFTQDSPTDPVYLFNNSNVVDGMFNRVGSPRKDRHSVVHVQWNDPDDQYKQKIEYVEDSDLVKSLGYRRLDTIAFGCTSRAQAYRVGLWILYTEKVETNMTSFEVGLDGLMVQPGDVVKIQDQWRAGKRNGGRLKAVSKTGCTLDKAVNIQAGASISVRMPNGKFEERRVNQTGDNVSVVTFAAPLSELPLSNAVWIMSEPSLVPSLGRVVSVAQSEKPHQFVISVVDHNPSKFASVEQGLQLESLPTTILDPTYSNPIGMVIEESTYLVSAGQIATKITASWQGKSPTYFLQWRMTNGATTSGWQSETLNKPTFEVLNVIGGAVYDFKVIAQSVTGKLSAELVGTYVALGTGLAPKPPTNLTAVGNFRQVNLAWVNSNDIDFDYVEIFENTVDDLKTAAYLDRTPGNTYTRSGVPTLMRYYYWVRTVNKRGMRSAFNSTAGTSAVAGVIAKTDLDVELSKQIESIAGVADDIAGDIKKLTEGLKDEYKEISDEIDGKANDALKGAGEAKDAAERARKEVEEAMALAQAARSGNAIEEMLRNDDNVQMKRNIEILGVEVNENISAKITKIEEAATSDKEAAARTFKEIEASFERSTARISKEEEVRANGEIATAKVIEKLQLAVDDNKANIIKETDARVSKDDALVTRLDGISVDVGKNNAAILKEERVRADAVSAEATRIDTLITKNDNAQAAITKEERVRVEGDTALGIRIDQMKVDVGKNSAAITKEEEVRASAVDAVARRIDEMKTTVDGHTASITKEEQVRADAIKTQAEATRVMRADWVENNIKVTARITDSDLVRAAADDALSRRITELKSTVDGHTGSITKESETRALANETIARDMTILRTDMSQGDKDITALIKKESETRSKDDESIARDLTILTSNWKNNNIDVQAAFTSEINTRTNADGALANRIDNLFATNGVGTAAIQVEADARVNGDDAVAGLVTKLGTKTKLDIEAAVTTVTDARITSEGIITRKVDKAQSDANGASTSASTAIGAFNSLDGKLSSSWTAKVQATSNGYVYIAGMGVGIQNTAQGLIQSQILLQADRVVMLNPNSNVQVTPFQLIENTVYLDSAVIRNGTIDFLKISDTLQSSNWWPQTSGWRFAKDGGLEINGNVGGLGRLNLSNNALTVFDANGVLRVRMGMW